MSAGPGKVRGGVAGALFFWGESMGKFQRNGELVNFDGGLLGFIEFHDGAIEPSAEIMGLMKVFCPQKWRLNGS